MIRTNDKTQIKIMFVFFVFESAEARRLIILKSSYVKLSSLLKSPV